MHLNRSSFVYSSVAACVAISSLSPERQWQAVVKSLRAAAWGCETLNPLGVGSGVKHQVWWIFHNFWVSEAKTAWGYECACTKDSWHLLSRKEWHPLCEFLLLKTTRWCLKDKSPHKCANKAHLSLVQINYLLHRSLKCNRMCNNIH